MAAEFDFDEVVAIQIIGRLKGQVCADAHGQGTNHRIADGEVVVEVA